MLEWSSTLMPHYFYKHFIMLLISRQTSLIEKIKTVHIYSDLQHAKVCVERLSKTKTKTFSQVCLSHSQNVFMHLNCDCFFKTLPLSSWMVRFGSASWALHAAVHQPSERKTARHSQRAFRNCDTVPFNVPHNSKFNRGLQKIAKG